MFTGIIRDIGEVIALDKKDGHWRIEIKCNLDLAQADIGASIACSGCCLTVVEKTQDSFTVDVSLETLDKTGIGSWDIGTKVNLEPSLKIGDELGGHLVSGHVDAQGHIDSIEKAGDSWKVTISVPDEFAKYMAPKGSVTVDGISLTINAVAGNSFDVNIIPHTWEVTTLGGRTAGEHVNIEIDQIARYVDRLLCAGGKTACAA